MSGNDTLYPLETGNPLAFETGCLVLPVFATRRLHGAAKALDEASDGRFSSLLERGGMRGRRGEALLLFDVPGARADRVLAIGCGARRGVDARRFRTIAENAATELGRAGGGDALSCLSQVRVFERDRHWRLRQLIESLEAARYRFDECRGTGRGDDADREGRERSRRRRVAHALVEGASLERARRSRDEALACAGGTALARDLGNRPPGRCTPSALADAARALAAHPHVEVEVLDETALEAHGMGGVLAVSRGSAEPAAFAIVRYRHPDADAAPEVLIGKGVTFDSGGLSLKQAAGMQHMKLDMGGAAAVLGAMEAIARLAPPLHVVALVAAVENMPGSRAVRPGDVVTMCSGHTVEILNTDAEGRLVLADALAYSRRLDPAAVIDVATLTGAAKAALGRPVHALFSDDRSLERALIKAGEEAHDRAWSMPLLEDYRHVLHSKVADLANVGGSSAGACVAACFLWRFAHGLRWAHLDVAGTASNDGAATGRPVGLLVRYLLERARRGREKRETRRSRD